MKKLLFSICCILTMGGFAQSSGDSAVLSWKEKLLNDTNLVKMASLNDLGGRDLSYLFTTEPTDQPLGFIGNDYQRFDIIYTSVKKDSGNLLQYIITGKNRVKSNKCDFKGTIRITDAGFYTNKNLLGKYPDSVKLGLLVGEYRFEEDTTQKHVGTLQGFVAVRYYVDPDNMLYPDDWNVSGDHYYNNQYVGTWRSYNGKQVNVCHWGNSRIPASGDLDNGEKMFMPADKYKANGWDKYPSLLNTIWWK